jgi:hypothetical protein
MSCALVLLHHTHVEAALSSRYTSSILLWQAHRITEYIFNSETGHEEWKNVFQ